MAIKLEQGSTPTKSFKLNGLDYQQGAYEIIYRDQGSLNPQVGLRNVTTNEILQNPSPFTEWVNGADTPYGSFAVLVADITAKVFKSGGGNGGGVTVGQTVANYSSLVDGTADGELAYVQTSEGTAWLPGTLGGTYYPAGIYLWAGGEWTSDRNAIVNQLETSKRNSEIRVTQQNKGTTLGGTIDSTRVYFLDGIIDMGSTQITVPATGISIKGDSFDISGLISSQDNYTMFISATVGGDGGGSGNVLGADYYISVTGAGSKVYEIYDDTGFNAFEFARLNYINCTDLGDIHNYRQGLEEGTGRFGGSPSLTLHGLWRGGYRITTSIVRSLAGTMTKPLFKEGLIFQMNSRFLTDINCDLPTLAPFSDFKTFNFPNPSTVQLKGTIFTRDGGFNPNDTNIFSDLEASDLACDWDNNIGIKNTFIGGALNNDVAVETVIATLGTAVDLNGTFTPRDLQHFDTPANGRLRHIGTNPTDFLVTWDLLIDGKNNDNYEIFLIKIDSLANVTVEISQVRTVNNFQGGRDVGIWTGSAPVTLNQNDLVFWQIANLLDTDNCTLEVDSTWTITER